jgi:site-specific DNA recombinase
MWMGGVVPVGYEVKDRQLVINPTEAERVRVIYRMYLKLGCVSKVQEYLDQTGIRSKERTSRTGRSSGGAVYSRGALYGMLQNHIRAFGRNGDAAQITQSPTPFRMQQSMLTPA